jgi:hypothetical protein
MHHIDKEVRIAAVKVGDNQVFDGREMGRMKC